MKRTLNVFSLMLLTIAECRPQINQPADSGSRVAPTGRHPEERAEQVHGRRRSDHLGAIELFGLRDSHRAV